MKIQTQSERGFSFLYTYRVATSNTSLFGLFVS